MPLITVVIVLVVVGVLLWGVNAAGFIAPQMKQIINIVVTIAVVLWLLSLFVPMGNLNTIRVGR